MALFAYKGQLNGAENPVDVHVIIGRSSTVAVGEAVKMEAFSSGSGVIRATAGSKVMGIVVGIVNEKGIDLDNAPGTYDGTWTSATKTYASTSDNDTDKKIKAIVRIDPLSLWENETAGTLATADLFKFFDLTSATQMADQNGSDTIGAFRLVEINPDTATVGTFHISEPYTWAFAQA